MSETTPASPAAEQGDPGKGRAIASFQAYGNHGTMYEDSLRRAEDATPSPIENPARRAGPFIDALHELEGKRQESPLLDLFAADCELWRQPYARPYRGQGEASEFWQSYLDQFDHVSSRFTEVTERDDLAVLEWEGQGALKGGRPMHYRGVTILLFDPEGKVRSLRTYFDSSTFIHRSDAPH